MPKTTKYLLLSGVLVVALAGCGQRPQPAESAASAAAAPAAAPEAVEANRMAEKQSESAAPMTADKPAPGQQTPAQIAQQMVSSANSYGDGQRQFVRTADVNFAVKDVYQSALVIEDSAAGMGGFVVRNEIHSDTGRTLERSIGDGKLLELTEYTVHGSLEVRVPSAKTQPFLRALAEQIVFLNQRTFNAEDVSLQVLRQQLSYRRAQETQQSLGQLAGEGGHINQRADVITSQTEAKASRDEAELAQREFEDKVAFSTITLELTQSPQVRQSEAVDVSAVLAQQGPGFGQRLGGALAGGWHGLLDLSVVLAAAWPLWVVAAGVVVGYVGYRRRCAGKPTDGGGRP